MGKSFCFVLFVLEPLYAQEENTDATNDYLLIINAIILIKMK